MSLEIKSVHLQYAWDLMEVPLKYPDYFYSDSGIFYCLFIRIDEKATHIKRQKIDDPQIEPSHFGEVVIMYSEYITPDKDQGSEVEKEAIVKSFQDTFLNLAAWYILPLIAAAKPNRPYMPENWTSAFLAKIQGMDDQSYEVYANDVLDFLKNVNSKGWMRPYEEIASKLGKDVQKSLLILVGMFLEAYREQMYEDLEPPPSFVIDFIEGIEAVDSLDNEN